MIQCSGPTVEQESLNFPCPWCLIDMVLWLQYQLLIIPVAYCKQVSDLIIFLGCKVHYLQRHKYFCISRDYSYCLSSVLLFVGSRKAFIGISLFLPCEFSVCTSLGAPIEWDRPRPCALSLFWLFRPWEALTIAFFANLSVYLSLRTQTCRNTATISKGPPQSITILVAKTTRLLIRLHVHIHMLLCSLRTNIWYTCRGGKLSIKCLINRGKKVMCTCGDFCSQLRAAAGAIHVVVHVKL